MKKNKVLYTCITGNYDQIINHDFIHPDYDYVCFTDNPPKDPEKYIWQFKPLQFDKLDNARNNRWHKLHPHLLFSQYEESLYLDGNINIKNQAFFEQLQNFENKTEFMRLQPHFFRQNIYDEFEECIKISKDDVNLMKLQMKEMKNSGFDGNYYHQHFFENNIILRRHHSSECQKAMTDWWWWLENYSYRDQLSLTYVLWQNNFLVEYLFPKNIRQLNFVEFHNTIKHSSREMLLKKIKDLQHLEKEWEQIKKFRKLPIYKIYDKYHRLKNKFKKHL